MRRFKTKKIWFRKGIKSDMGLFIELTKITLCSLDAVYEEAQNYVKVERELKSSSKTYVYRPS